MIELTFYDFHEHYYEIRDKWMIGPNAKDNATEPSWLTLNEPELLIYWVIEKQILWQNG